MAKFKVGDIVYYKDEKKKDPFVVYHVYSKNHVSLSLRDYPDTEQDFQIHVSKIRKFSKKDLPKAKQKIKKLLG